MTHHEFTVGNIRCVVVPDDDGTDAIDHATLIGIFPPLPEIETAIKSLPEPQLFSMNCLLIETDGQRILVDTGIGNLNPEQSPHLLESLREIGITPDQIDIVLITHGHMDHIGGMVNADHQLVFANARHLMSRIDFEHWTGPAARPVAEPVYRAMRARLEMIEAASPIAPGVRTVAAFGHTPGQLSVVIESDWQKFMHIADTAHHPIQASQPTWSPRFDYDPLQSAESRRALFEQAAAEGFRLMAYHFGFPGIGTVQRSGDGLVFVPAG